RFPNGEVNDQAIRELEVLYENSKKRFAKDAEFRERTQPVICTNLHGSKSGKTLHDHYIGKTRKLLRKKGYNTDVEGDEADGELEHTAEALGYRAVKYKVLNNNRLTDYTFSFDDMFKETGNTAVYLQNTHARICSSFGKSKNMLALAEKFFALKDVVTLKDDRERQLGLHLLRFTEVVGEVCRVLAPHILCDYLFVLCDKFNGLYSDSGQKGKYHDCFVRISCSFKSFGRLKQGKTLPFQEVDVATLRLKQGKTLPFQEVDVATSRLFAPSRN
nr:aminoacyl-tRNA synthetase, class 1a, anticodon-binding [Tanacetum cinerariifolium]